MAVPKDLASDVFWAQMNQLLILISRSASFAVQCLCDGIVQSIGTQNALSLALLGRATIEHSCALCWLRGKIARHADVLSTEVWPAAQSAPSLEITEEFRDLRRELFRFALGARVELNPIDIPEPSASKTKWQNYTKGRGKSIPESIRAEQFMKYVDHVVSFEDYRDFRDIYESLSEYCHPNSASRTLEFHSSHADHRKFRLVLAAGIPFSIGFFNVFDLVRAMLAKYCDRLVQDLDLIEACRMPMSPLPAEDTAMVPPPGRVAATDMFTARTFWVKPSQIHPPAFSPGKLTADQTKRAQAVAHAFSEIVNRSEDEWLRLFGMNLDIEAELRISEKMVTVYQAEVNERPG